MPARQLPLALASIASITTLALTTLACSGREEPTSGDGIADVDDEADDPSTNADTASESAGDDATSGAKLDFANEDLPFVDSGCSKVDFLFVIDSSVSMGDQQLALIASFPQFMATLDELLPAQTDYRILVTDTDATSRCTPETCAAASDANVVDLCLEDGRGSHACTGIFEPCDTVLGAGVTHPSGEGSSNGVCFDDPQRWIAGDDVARDDKFACAAQLGLAGSGQERPMDALVAALGPTNNGVGGCNEGFVRDDAVLVVTFISDDPNYEDMGDPASWYDALVSAKLGDPSASVVLGLIPVAPDCMQQAGKISGAHWAEFVGLFGEYGLVGSVCSAEYGSFFAQAVGVIVDACENYVPPG